MFSYAIDEENKLIKFRIKDTGIGVEEKEQHSIFNRFKRVDGEYAIKVGGLGLGLAITKAYVEMLGGDITIQSKLGIGSVFEFYIPLKIASTESFAQISNQEVIKQTIHSEKTILIAEDDNINYLLIEKIMKLKNLNIIRAVDGEEAVEICKTNQNLSMVLMDIKMPKLNGFEAIEKIKEFNTNLPIVAQTAYSSYEDKEKIITAGFSAFVTKPINKEKLFTVINEMLVK